MLTLSYRNKVGSYSRSGKFVRVWFRICGVRYDFSLMSEKVLFNLRFLKTFLSSPKKTHTHYTRDRLFFTPLCSESVIMSNSPFRRKHTFELGEQHNHGNSFGSIYFSFPCTLVYRARYTCKFYLKQTKR